MRDDDGKANGVKKGTRCWRLEKLTCCDGSLWAWHVGDGAEVRRVNWACIVNELV